MRFPTKQEWDKIKLQYRGKKITNVYYDNDNKLHVTLVRKKSSGKYLKTLEPVCGAGRKEEDANP